MRLVLASHNAGKLAELQALFAPLLLELVAQPSLGLAEAEEPHLTFIENALAKARHAAQATGQAALADDSGLCVDELGGAPGVVSAHYASVELLPGDREAQRRQQDAANNALLLQRLQGHAVRRASFVCTLVALRSAGDPQPLVATGRWQGEILSAARGSGGFGYDPVMYIPALGATVAELPRELKNAQSHRALACRQMLQLMREAWGLA
ncbi:MAG: RdgB/HAM1 family non-canonical purine NTP pyrophosphatase [Burkholderiaceae bacterium]|nr:RdgB/HAM1 family non-canonical purine NTP pyrophosphatase [Burkholderiaceae bacterium]MCU0963977.1 RdgB/HAM1 family non-canonical purine NTP pyrophosphatase [Burkholderiaceae bacterium]